MSESVSVCQCAGGPMESKEEKPTAPLLPAVQPAQLLPAVQPARRPRSRRPCSRPSNLRQCSRSTSWTSPNDTSRPWPSLLGVRSALLVSRVGGAHSVALVLYYFNTDQCTMYCVLYVFLFINYNSVFFIMQPCEARSRLVSLLTYSLTLYF